MVEQNANKLIVKNTLLLYLRSFLMMAVGIYTSRVILQALGVDDFGLYGIVGTVVGIFTFINGVLAQGTSRFITFELGGGNQESLKKTFSVSFAMHMGMAIILLVLLETIGLWFVNTYVNIPSGREYAANWCYQLSVLTCFLGLTQVPYGALIIAYEKMDLFAYIGIAETVFKLVLPMALIYGDFKDNLIAYAIIITLWSVGMQVFYRIYCNRHFPETRLIIVKDRSLYKDMLSYSIWDLLGQICASVNGQGVSVLINMFFGVRLNAAQNVAGNLQGKVDTFVSNFMTAVNPQIVKSYAEKDYNRFFQLIYESGRYSYYLFLFIALPIYLECDYILDIWLVEVPEYATIFLRFTMVIALVRTIARPLINAVHATGNVKFMNATSGLFSVVMMIPGTYLLFSLGMPFWSFLVLRAICSLNAIVWEIISLYRNIKFSVWHYVSNVYLKVVCVTFLSIILPSFSVWYLEPSFSRFLLTSFVCIFSSGACVFFVGIDKSVRCRVLLFLRNRFSIYIP